MPSSAGRSLCTLVLALAMTACSGDGGGSSSSATAGATPAPPPSDGELLTSLLTPSEIGSDFTGPPPVVTAKDAADDDPSSKPLCDIASDVDPVAGVSVGPITNTGSAEQVYEELTVAATAAEAEQRLDVQRQRAEARCRFDQTVATTTYTVQVEGPVEAGNPADEAVGLSQAYTGGYTGWRWDMTARHGRVLVNIQYTSTSAIDAERARELLEKAVDKAAVLS